MQQLCGRVMDPLRAMAPTVAPGQLQINSHCGSIEDRAVLTASWKMAVNQQF